MDAAHQALIAAETLRRAGQLQEAIAAFVALLADHPGMHDARLLLGRAQRDAGDLDDAVATFLEATVRQPDRVEAHNGLGLTRQARGDTAAAAACFERALTLDPERANARFNLAGALRALGRAEAARETYRALLEQTPDDLEIVLHVALLDLELGDEAEGRARLERAVTLEADRPTCDALEALAGAQAATGNLDGAIATLRRAAAKAPGSASPRLNLGRALKRTAALGESLAALDEALALDPTLAGAHAARASTLLAQGRVHEALEAGRAALRECPDDASAHSNLLLAQNYDIPPEPNAVWREHQAWGARFAARTRPTAPVWDGVRPLRVGYVSADFRAHSVAYFLEPLLEAHDRARVTVTAYASVARPDAVTARLRERCDQWVDAHGMSDEALADRIAADGVDVLVDLSGHSGAHRLAAFARRPARLLVTYLGYPNTTGLEAMDLRLVDAISDPEGAPWAGTERLVRLEGGAWCFRPDPQAPAPAPRPAGPIRFGSFNTLPKLSGATIAMFADAMRAVTGSTLTLKNPSLSDAATAERVRARFADAGIDPARIDTIGFVPDVAAHLACYHAIDIALDTYPYAGTTTTCEALWMGVPVVTRTGPVHASRVGASLLARVGLEDLVAADAASFTATAARLAQASARRATLRTALRTRLAGGPLGDARRLASAIEDALAEAMRRLDA